VPTGFHIGIWVDIPVGADPNYPIVDYSHPGFLVWENFCDSWVWNFAGYDEDPRPFGFENEACFQFNQLLSEDEWFKQDPNLPWPWAGLPDPFPNGTVYWLSISAIYAPGAVVTHPWGWKTRSPHWNDDAIRITSVEPPLIDFPPGSPPPAWPPTAGYSFRDGVPIEFPAGVSWDMAFELTTNEPAYKDIPIPGDVDKDGDVDLGDFKEMAAHWLETAP